MWLRRARTPPAVLSSPQRSTIERLTSAKMQEPRPYVGLARNNFARPRLVPQAELALPRAMLP